MDTCHPVVTTWYLDPLSVSLSTESECHLNQVWGLYMRVQTVDGDHLGPLNCVKSAVCHSSQFSSTLTQVAFIRDSLKLNNSPQCILSALILVYLHHIFTSCQAAAAWDYISITDWQPSNYISAIKTLSCKWWEDVWWTYMMKNPISDGDFCTSVALNRVYHWN